MKLNLFIIFLASTGLLNAVFLTLVLFFSKTGNIRANRVLGLLTFSIALKIYNGLALHMYQSWTLIDCIFAVIADVGYLSFGPLLLLYVLYTLDSSKVQPLYWLLLLPSFVPFYIWFNRYPEMSLWVFQSWFLIFLLYTVYTVIKFYSKSSSNFLISQKMRMITIITFMFILWLCIFSFMINETLYLIELGAFLAVLFYVFIFLLMRFNQNKISSEKIENYQNSNLSDNESALILDAILKLFKENPVYRDQEITLPKVAKLISVAPHKLSQVINQRLEMNFNEFVNSYRIRDIKKALVSDAYENYTIAGIAFDHGFNSLSTFNTFFKKSTGQTPTQYRASYVMKN